MKKQTDPPPPTDKPKRRPHTELRRQPGDGAAPKAPLSGKTPVPRPKPDPDGLDDLFNDMPV